LDSNELDAKNAHDSEQKQEEYELTGESRLEVRMPRIDSKQLTAAQCHPA
jgi:hypothetical protein